MVDARDDRHSPRYDNWGRNDGREKTCSCGAKGFLIQGHIHWETPHESSCTWRNNYFD